MSLRRLSMTREITIPASGTDSNAFYFGDWAMGILHLPGTMTGDAITFKAAPAENGTYNVVKKSDGTAAGSSVTAASDGVPIPAECAGALWLKVVSDAAEDTARTIQVSLKG